MPKSHVGTYQPPSELVHKLLSNLTTIIGHSQLLEESLPHDQKYLQHLRRIHETAKAMAEDLKNHEHSLEANKKAG